MQGKYQQPEGSFLVHMPKVTYVTTGGKKWLQINKFEWNEIEFRCFHHSICLNELVILVGWNIKVGKLIELWPSNV